MSEEEISIQERIIDVRKVPASELMDNERNWREHPHVQESGMEGLLEQVGNVDVLLAYESERQGGLTLLDGHLRKSIDPDREWWTAILDLTDEEADLVLATHDPVSAMAVADQAQMDEVYLDAVTEAEDVAVRNVLDEMKAANGEKSIADMDVDDEEEVVEGAGEEEGPPEMEIQPFEHRDYIVFVTEETWDMQRLIEEFDIGRAAYTVPLEDGGTKRKIALGRVLPASALLDKLDGATAPEAAGPEAAGPDDPDAERSEESPDSPENRSAQSGPSTSDE